MLGRGGAAVNVAEFLRQLQARVPGCEAINIRLAGQAEVEISMFIAESVYPFAVSDDEWSDLPALLDELVEWFEEWEGGWWRAGLTTATSSPT